MAEPKVNECLLVSVDFTAGLDKGILLVGRKKEGQDVEVINALHGNEALELYNKLVKVKNTRPN